MHVFIQIPSGSQPISHLLLGENFLEISSNVKFPENLQPYCSLFGQSFYCYSTFGMILLKSIFRNVEVGLFTRQIPFFRANNSTKTVNISINTVNIAQPVLIILHHAIIYALHTSNGKYVCFCSCPTCKHGKNGYLDGTTYQILSQCIGDIR